MDNKEFQSYAQIGLRIGIIIIFIILALLFPIPAVILAIVYKVLKALK